MGLARFLPDIRGRGHRTEITKDGSGEVGERPRRPFLLRGGMRSVGLVEAAGNIFAAGIGDALLRLA
jgi:hypothetical protein